MNTDLDVEEESNVFRVLGERQRTLRVPRVSGR